MNIPPHQIENVLKAYKKSLISAKKGFFQKSKNRFNEKKIMLRNKILADIARRTADLTLRPGELKPGELKPDEGKTPKDSKESIVEYNSLGPDGKEMRVIDIKDLLNP